MTKLRCKPGDRAKVIRAVRPENVGLVVVVARPYDGVEAIGGLPWASNGPAWVVVALGKLIASIDKKGTVEANRTAVLDDVNLVPLDDDDCGGGVVVTKKKSRAKKQYPNLHRRLEVTP